MKREIKFRAWDTTNRRMWFSDDYKHGLSDFFKDEDDNFMQYTGLKDKNGKEIYEGDTLKVHLWEDKHIIETVKWADNDSLRNCGFDPFIQYLSFSQEDFEIIGNIYSNPELLEKK